MGIGSLYQTLVFEGIEAVLGLAVIIAVIVIATNLTAKSKKAAAELADTQLEVIRAAVPEGEDLRSASHFIHIGTGARVALTDKFLRLFKFQGAQLMEQWAFDLSDLSGLAHEPFNLGTKQLRFSITASGGQHMFISGSPSDAAFVDALNRAMGFQSR